MARIRSLKPEFKTHPVVGRLSDRDLRLFISMITEADDEGRLVADTTQLRLLVWGFHPKVQPKHVEQALANLESAGLIRAYIAFGVRYAEITGFKKHQRIQKPSASKIPPYQTTEGPNSATVPRPVGEQSLNSPRRVALDRSIKDQGSRIDRAERLIPPPSGETTVSDMVARSTMFSNPNQSQDGPRMKEPRPQRHRYDAVAEVPESWRLICGCVDPSYQPLIDEPIPACTHGTEKP
jgi:hypothetical protein